MNDKLYDFLTRLLPKLLPAVCLVSFLLFDAVWISILVAAVCFGCIYAVQVFIEQSQGVMSTYLYVTILMLVLTVVEYNYGFLQSILN